MARKSKGKFTMKGCSPFKIENEDRTNLEFADIETPDQDANKAKSQAEGQSGVNYGLQELISMRNRLKAKKQKIEDPSETLEEQTTKYDVTDLKEGQQGPHPEGDQDGDGVLDKYFISRPGQEKQGPKHDRDGDGVPDYIQRPNTESKDVALSEEATARYMDIIDSNMSYEDKVSEARSLGISKEELDKRLKRI